jgi:hypothetical protein
MPQTKGTPTAITTIKAYIDNGQQIPVKLKDDLLFGALLDIYEVQAYLRKEIEEMKPWVSLWKWCASVLGAAILLLMLSILTHTFKFP